MDAWYFLADNRCLAPPTLPPVVTLRPEESLPSRTVAFIDEETHPTPYSPPVERPSVSVRPIRPEPQTIRSTLKPTPDSGKKTIGGGFIDPANFVTNSPATSSKKPHVPQKPVVQVTRGPPVKTTKEPTTTPSTPAPTTEATTPEPTTRTVVTGIILHLLLLFG